MTAGPSEVRWGNIVACLLLVWAGLTIGVAFIATPAKFLATTLNWPGWLDVGRHTFAVYNRIELVLVMTAAFVVLRSGQHTLLRAISVPALIVLTETLWPIPALDRGVVAFIEGKQALPGSPLHYVYIAAEFTKTVALICFGWRLLNTAPVLQNRVV